MNNNAIYGIGTTAAFGFGIVLGTETTSLTSIFIAIGLFALVQVVAYIYKV